MRRGKQSGADVPRHVGKRRGKAPFWSGLRVPGVAPWALGCSTTCPAPRGHRHHPATSNLTAAIAPAIAPALPEALAHAPPPPQSHLGKVCPRVTTPESQPPREDQTQGVFEEGIWCWSLFSFGRVPRRGKLSHRKTSLQGTKCGLSARLREHVPLPR